MNNARLLRENEARKRKGHHHRGRHPLPPILSLVRSLVMVHRLLSTLAINNCTEKVSVECPVGSLQCVL